MLVEKPWAVPKSEVAKSLNTSLDHGLTWEEVRSRLHKYGLNELEKSDKPSSLLVLLRQLQSPLIYLLFVAVIITLIQQDWFDAIAISVVILINTLIGWAQEFKAEKTMSKLHRIIAPHAKVIREGAEHKILANHLVVGDIIKVEAGDRLGADARIIEAQALQTNEAILTGESKPKYKRECLLSDHTTLADRVNMLYLSTTVVAGSTLAVVTSTGMETELGKIAKSVVSLSPMKTHLQRKMANYGKLVISLAVFVGLLTITIGLIRGIDPLEIFKASIALLVSVVPEGLPVAITVILSIGLVRMFRRHSIIRVLEAAETIGSVTVIAFDKTGTVTEGQMMVEKILTYREEYTVTGSGYALSGRFIKDDKPLNVKSNKTLSFLLESSSLATMSTISKDDLKRDRAKGLTDPTETALAVVAAKAGYYAFEEEKENPEILEMPFDQRLRLSASIHRFPRFNRYIVKGAPEQILSKCSNALNGNMVKIKLLKNGRSQQETRAENYAGNGYRVIAMAYCDRPKSENINHLHIDDLTLIGFLCMDDPLRPQAASALEKASKAGIRLIMLTGDHLLTAKVIGDKLGLSAYGETIHSDDIDSASLNKVSVISRCSPNDKLRIIERLQKNGQIVAMTGDGVNDAPALKKADIGIAMGKSGTDIAVEASSMVLLDDRLETIVDSVQEGRLIWENLRKVISYLSTSSFDEAIVIVSTLLLGMPLPFIALQILWINLVTDGVTTMALTNEKEESDLMDEPPRDPKAFLIDRAAIWRIIIVSAVMAAGSIWMFYLMLPRGLEYARSSVITIMVFFQAFNLLNFRSYSRSIFSMKWNNNAIFITLFISILLQFMVINLPYLQKILHLTSLDLPTIVLAISIAMSVMIAEEIRKFIHNKLVRTKKNT